METKSDDVMQSWSNMVALMRDTEGAAVIGAFGRYMRKIVREEIERRHPYPGAYCVYCNAQLPHSENGEAAKKHVVNCEKSPSFKLAQTLASVREQLAASEAEVLKLREIKAPKKRNPAQRPR